MRITMHLLILTAYWLPLTATAGKLPAELPPEAMTGNYIGPEGGSTCLETPQEQTPGCMTAEKLEGLTDRVVTDAIEQRQRPGIPPTVSPPSSLPEPPMTPLQQHIKDLIGR
ncbi:MAG: hypothetical protein Q8J78_04050 [Moraxellaceae bacterium]|nr:hypothetical protein [Moraxellaceae bacterium]